MVELVELEVMPVVVKEEQEESVFLMLLQEVRYHIMVEVEVEQLHQVQEVMLLLVEQVELEVEAVQDQQELLIEVAVVELEVETVVGLDVETQVAQVSLS